MAKKRRLFATLSAKEESNLLRAKAELSARFLPRPASAALPIMAFRAMAPTAASAVSSNVVGVGIDEKHVNGVPTGTHVVKFLVKTKCPSRPSREPSCCPLRTTALKPTRRKSG